MIGVVRSMRDADFINTAPFVGVGGLRVCVYTRRCTGSEVGTCNLCSY